ncbi:DUF935 family protein, partial [candidate division KSB3 bacterium]|nr:DUF935 family protein [candidate division KSB3 bacterium]
ETLRITDIRDKDAARFRFEGRTGLRADDHSVNPAKFIMYRPRAILDNPYGLSEIRSLTNILFSKNQFLRFLERHLERWGSGQFFLQYPDEKEGKRYANYQAWLLSEARKLRNQGVGVLPKGVVMEVMESAGAGTLFIDALTYLDDLIAIAFTGNNMSLKSPSVGSYALSENTTAVAKSEYELNDASGLSHACSTMTHRLSAWNFGNVPAPYVQLIHPSKYLPAQDAARREQVDHTTEAAPSQITLHQDSLPPILQNPVVQTTAKQFLANQQVALRDEFDELPGGQKNKTYTVKGVADIGILRQMQAAIMNSLHLPEDAAWEAYRQETGDIWEGQQQSIPLAFRHARQNAYQAGLDALAASDQSYTLAEYITKDDSRVRLNHDLMHGVIRPIDDPIWKTWTPANGFNCRCLKVPRRDGDITPDEDLPEVLPDRHFRGDNEDEEAPPATEGTRSWT